jgi:predicted Rossmann-fold nucleotide-binding protein
MLHEHNEQQSQNSIEQRLAVFKEQEKISHIIGIIGGSGAVSTNSVNLLTNVLSEVNAKTGRFAVQTGGTTGGVAEAGINIAKSLALPTIGVYPKLGEKYALKDKLDLAISIEAPGYGGQIWGSETPVFVAIPDVFLLVGGEWGTNAEVSMIMKRNKDRIKVGLLPNPIISIVGSGKLADEMTTLTKIFPTPEGAFFSSNNSSEVANIIALLFTK